MSKNKRVIRKFPLSMGYYGEVNGMYSISEQTRDWREKVESVFWDYRSTFHRPWRLQ